MLCFLSKNTHQSVSHFALEENVKMMQRVEKPHSKENHETPTKSAKNLAYSVKKCNTKGPEMQNLEDIFAMESLHVYFHRDCNPRIWQT
jgi:predicted SprT family Zn-dependent metalloprotease